MKDQKIVEEMARLEGKWPDVEGEIEWIEKSYRFFYDVTTFENGSQFRFSHMMPDYPNSHDACQRVIDGIIDLGHCIDFVINLGEILRNEDNQPSSILLNLVQEEDVRGLSFSIYNFLRATPRQKCEAILKTYGQWEDE